MDNNTIHAALFDLDGVLIDSEGLYSQFWHSMNQLYPTGIKNFEQVIKGTTLPDILNRYFQDPEVQADIVARLKDFEANMTLEFFEGVPEFVNKLRASGWRTAVVTSSNRAKMDSLSRRLPGFDSLFDTILTDADVTRSKPDPQGYQLAAERLCARPCDCIVFEDSLKGLQAGRSSGAKVVAVATTNPRDVVAPLADQTVDSVVDTDIEALMI